MNFRNAAQQGRHIIVNVFTVVHLTHVTVHGACGVCAQIDYGGAKGYFSSGGGRQLAAMLVRTGALQPVLDTLQLKLPNQMLRGELQPPQTRAFSFQITGAGKVKTVDGVTATSVTEHTEGRPSFYRYLSNNSIYVLCVSDCERLDIYVYRQDPNL